MQNKFYVTTPIYYVNDKPHIGHAYTTLAADIVARYYRLKGYDVFFLTGVDEHGQKLENAAKSVNKEPKIFADEVVVHFKNMNSVLNITNNHFIRTTDEYHKEFCKLMFKLLKDKGDIYKGKYEGLYCVGCEKFIRELDLIDGKCPFHKIEPETLSEESYFFRLSRYQDKLLEFYDKNPDFISPSFRKQEIINRVKEGLNDLSISRETIKWGIPIPGDPKHVMYVWIDALSNYISALDYPNEKFKKYWPANLHLIGKDIIWFHTVIWPAMLMSAGFELPKKVFAHGFWTVNGDKMSKSLGNVIDPLEMKNKYGLEVFKFYLFSRAQFGKDNDFSETDLIDCLNTQLADNLGNLVNRIFVLINKYFNSCIDIPDSHDPLLEEFSKLFVNVPKILDLYENLEFQGVLNEIFDIVSNMNKYISEKKPWDLYKQQKMEDLQKILYNLVEGIRIVCILLKPIMHETSDKVLDSLGLKDQDLSMITWMDKKGFKDCIQVKVNSLILFTKLEIKVEKENILQYLDYKVGKIIDIEEHQKSGQYYLMTIDIESKKIPVIAKITKSYSISDLINKTVPVLVNLKPKKILGIESEGMLIGGVDKTTNDLKIAFIEGKPGEQILVGDFKPIKKELNEKQFAKYIIKSKNNTVLVNDQPLHTKNNKPKIDLPDDISLF